MVNKIFLFAASFYIPCHKHQHGLQSVFAFSNANSFHRSLIKLPTREETSFCITWQNGWLYLDSGRVNVTICTWYLGQLKLLFAAARNWFANLGLLIWFARLAPLVYVSVLWLAFGICITSITKTALLSVNGESEQERNSRGPKRLWLDTFYRWGDGCHLVNLK